MKHQTSKFCTQCGQRIRTPAREFFDKLPGFMLRLVIAGSLLYVATIVHAIFSA
jgi:hypothetical protein